MRKAELDQSLWKWSTTADSPEPADEGEAGGHREHGPAVEPHRSAVALRADHAANASRVTESR